MPVPPSPAATAPLALVTGGACFIGSHLAEHLGQNGWRVRILDNFSSGRRENLAAGAPGMEIVAGDIRDRDQVRAACAGVSAVFHLAALVSVVESLNSSALTEDINGRSTVNVLDAAAEAGVKRAVFSSASAIDGDTPADPLAEDLPPAPASPYASTKIAGESLASHYAGRGLSVISLRYFNVYGPRQNPNSDYAAVIPRFIHLGLQRQRPIIYGDGGQTRDFIFVGDVARANLRAAEYFPGSSGAGVFNIGTGRAISVNSLWQHISHLVPCPPEATHAAARPGEVRHSRADISRAQAKLGFVPACSLEEGWDITLAALRASPPP